VVNAIAWARVSTDMQEARGLSIPEQLREIRAKEDQHGYRIAAEHQETASAFQDDSKRVEFQRMLAIARADPDIGAIVVHDYSRLSRDSLRARTLVRELRQQGIRVISLNDPETDPETVAGVYMEAITFAKNEAYSREVAFHTRKGCRANVQTRDPETGWCYKNGGQPLFGYRSQQLARGEERRGRPIIKSIWVLDDTVVAGRPLHEWARHCLVELAGKGASLDELMTFCNESGIPARRGKYWGVSTWYALLQPHMLLQCCGHAVWNVHRKNGSLRPTSEWVIVENAHPALITEEQAQAIAAVRSSARRRGFDAGTHRSQSSPYLLSGGLFKCERCGANMIGLRTSGGVYYVCGSQPYRKGMGCGPGVYVPAEEAEALVITGIRDLLGVCTDAKGLTRGVNQELRQLWEQSTGRDPNATRSLADVERKIGNVRRAIEEGLADAAWANTRLPELLQERDKLQQEAAPGGQPPQIDAAAALEYCQQLGKTLCQGNAAERKRIVRSWVGDMKLAPERLEVEWTYRIPEPIMNSVVAGAGFVVEKKTRTRRWIVETAFRMPQKLLGTVSRAWRMGDAKAK
jgi:DNA invertase Pin-like site-specific DNA recombinase